MQVQFKSKALEINLASTQVDVDIEARYSVLEEIFSKYYGLQEGLTTFLKEISHPYRNWHFIVQEARGYSLDYIHLLKQHPKGEDASQLFADIFFEALNSSPAMDVKIEAIDNLLLFLQKVIQEADEDIDKFLPMLNRVFDRICNADDETFFYFVKSYYSIKRLAELLIRPSIDVNTGYEAINRLLIKYLKHAYTYWMTENDPWVWFDTELEIGEDSARSLDFFKAVSHPYIRDLLARLSEISPKNHASGSKAATQALLTLPGYNAFVNHYRDIPQYLFDRGSESGVGNYWKVVFLFHIMNMSGLSTIHEETLRDINRTLSWLIAHETSLNISKLLKKTFSILKTRVNEFPTTVLNSVSNMGKGVYNTDDIELINLFIDYVIDLGFQSPMIKGVGNDWQIKVNPAHIQNLRIWLDLIRLNPRRSVRLLSHLIIHISLTGVFIKDTDLFPRDITRLLNSDIGPVYNLIKQLTRLFPAYFNDIGAEGKLRDISTQSDELSHRKDVLIHFLRKQSHVESSNFIIGFMENTLRFWATRDKQLIEPYVPPIIYQQVSESGPYIDGVNRILVHLKAKGFDLPNDLLQIDKDELSLQAAQVAGVADTDRERIVLIAEFYKLLHQKYNIGFIEIESYLEQLRAEGFPDLNRLQNALNEPNLKTRIRKLLNYLDSLKTLILSEETYEAKEDIYKKRHFTVDIPSMYGRYHERKFDALGLSFRIESLLNVLFEALIEDIDLSLITKATFFQIYDRLKLFGMALKLEGISSLEIERQIEMLDYSIEIRGFTFSQYLDIFKGFAQCVKNIINDYFNNIHGKNLTRAVSQMAPDQILPKFLPHQDLETGEKRVHRASEIFFRDRIALSLGLQQLDLFLSRILNTLFHQSNKLQEGKLYQLLLYDTHKVATPIDKVGKIVSGLVYLGNKGYHLCKLSKMGFPVPPGFIITTEAFRHRVLINSYQPAELNYKEQVLKELYSLEEKTGKKFGDLEKPLLLSVRSGSTISQPGMMDTFLNVGINESITERMAERTGNSWFAWDNYRRFLQCWGMAFGLERDDFDAIISEFKRRWSIRYKRNFTGAHMRKVAKAYKSMIENAGIDIMEDVFEQLFLTVKLVFASWNSPKAKTYRRIMGISDDWGTAVTLQTMIFGNSSSQSGTGVIFTHNPRWSGDTLRLWGDFTLGNQGEDVVSGLVNTLPISIFQQEIEMRDTDITLETHFPEIYATLKTWAVDLVEKFGWTPQEIEFTFEGPNSDDLYLLQTRDMSIRESQQVNTFDHEDITDLVFLGNGIGVSGGAMSGRLVFSLEDIDHWRNQEPDTSLILVRGDTVPDDIREIFAADGLLTAKGGVTSHAAVVAHRLEKTCVVGCGNLICNEKDKYCMFNRKHLSAGDFISIDGQKGSVYEGNLKYKIPKWRLL